MVVALLLVLALVMLALGFEMLMVMGLPAVLARLALHPGMPEVAIAQRLLMAVRASRYPFSTDMRPRMSIGISTTVDDADDYESLWMRADSALYVAKRAGRDRVAQEESVEEETQAI